jgi:hypothetical protein
MPGRPCGVLPQLRRLGALAPSPVHEHDGERTIGLGERHRRADRCRLECRSTVDQQGFQGLAEILDQMEAIDHLHRRWGPPTHAVRPADEFPHDHVDTHGKPAPGEVRHVALITAMH